MATILDQYGKPIDRRVLAEPQTAQLTQLQREYANHPARGLTPMKLVRILEEAEKGNLQAQAELFADMEERDAHLFAEMSKRKRAILSIDWTIQPPPNASAAEKKQAEFAAELMTDLAGWEDILLDALDGIGHGFSCLEIEWQQLGRTWLPKSLHHRPQSWFQVSQYDQNALHLCDNSPDGAELIPFGWVRHIHRAKSGYVARAGLHRILAFPYLFKNYAVRDLAELLEIYGMPLRLGKYPSGSGDAEKAALLRAVTQLGHSAAGIIPDTMSIDFENAAVGTEVPFEAMVELMERSMSKAILGGTLTSQADGKSSTNALGNVHNEVRHDLSASDCRQLGPTLSRDLVFPILVLNGQTIDDPRRRPRLVFDAREPEDIAALSDAIPKMVDVGLEVPQQWARRKFGVPDRQADEPILARRSAAPVTPPEPPAAARAALRAASEPSFPDQTLLDGAVTRLGANGGLQDQAAALMVNLLAQVQAADSPDAVLALLADAFPNMDDTQLQETLSNMLFAADLVGRLAADDESAA